MIAVLYLWDNYKWYLSHTHILDVSDAYTIAYRFRNDLDPSQPLPLVGTYAFQLRSPTDILDLPSRVSFPFRFGLEPFAFEGLSV